MKDHEAIIFDTPVFVDSINLIHEPILKNTLKSQFGWVKSSTNSPMFGPPPTPSIFTIFSSNTAAAITAGKANWGLAGHQPGTHPVVFTVSATGPVSGTSRLRSTPRWRATRQVYRRGSYLTKTKVDKISGDFPRFCQLYFSRLQFQDQHYISAICLVLSASYC